MSVEAMRAQLGLAADDCVLMDHRLLGVIALRAHASTAYRVTWNSAEEWEFTPTKVTDRNLFVEATPRLLWTNSRCARSL